MTPEEELNLIRTAASQNDALDISFELGRAVTIDQQLQVVRRGIDYATHEIPKQRQHFQSLNEDGLTVVFLISLNSLGFNCTHDNQQGGHVDLTIEGKNNFTWHGEAKIHKESYGWLLEGQHQLVDRYASGMAGSPEGSVIIYFFGDNMVQMMQRWRSKLKEYRNIKSDRDCKSMPPSFYTVENHPSTGLDYTVRHVGVPLKYTPSK